jgi:hypothetical protein
MSGLTGREGYSTGKYEAELSLVRKEGRMSVNARDRKPEAADGMNGSMSDLPRKETRGSGNLP